MELQLEIELEQSLVGGLMVKPKNMVEIIENISPDDFIDKKAKQVFATIIDLWKNKKPCDLLTVASADRSLMAFCAECTSKDFIPSGLLGYALKIKDNAQDRRIGAVLSQLQSDAYSGKEKLNLMLETYNRELETANTDRDIVTALQRTEEKIKTYQKDGVGISTGMEFFDKLDIQYIHGHVWLVTAFTSVGKTSYSLQMFTSMIKKTEGVKCLFVSTEMTEEQIVARLLGNICDIYSKKILSGNVREDDLEILEKAKSFLSSQNLDIYDDIYELEDVEHAIRKKHLQGGIDWVVIDYVQNMTHSKATSQYQEGATIAKRLQKLAKDCECTIICLSQVSNDVARGNTENLEAKGAGEWAAVTDVGLSMMKNKTQENQLLIEVKKNRHGAKGQQVFTYSPSYAMIYEGAYCE